MTADEMIAHAEAEGKRLYPGTEMLDKLVRISFERGMLQGYLKMMQTEFVYIQQNNEEEILKLNRQLIEKDD